MRLTGGVSSPPLDPLARFREWLDAVVAAEVVEPTTMVLATADAHGRPSARAVLLKGVDERGFRFFTNLRSAKAADLAANPACALAFVWPALARQVRVAGRAEQLSAEESAAYFATRPRGSRLGAWASPQSEVIESRQALDDRMAELEARFAGTDDIPLPPFWGGYVVVPERLEFWEGRSDRLHDRHRYRRSAPGQPWLAERLAP